jgi:hypothetical protein
MPQEKEPGQDSSTIGPDYTAVGDQNVHIQARDGGTVTIVTVRSNENLLETFPGLVLISVFLENAADAEEVEAAVRAAAEQLGLDIVADSPPVFGSWFKRMLARGRAEFTEERFRTAIESAMRAVELEQVEKRQAQVNATNIGAVAGLIDTLNDTPAAVVQIGSLILIKTPETLVARELTQAEQATLRDNPILLTNPAAAAAVLIPGAGIAKGNEQGAEVPQHAGD